MTTRRELLKTIGAGGASLALPAADNKPNFLFLFTDDQRFDTIAALGHPEVQTPNMDRLVRRGVSFTRACIMGSTIGAVCMPSRAMLLAGQSLFHVHPYMSASPPVATFPELLRNAGYTAFATGKWHNGGAWFSRDFSHGSSIFLGGMSDHLKVPVHEYDASGRYPKERLRIADRFSSELFSDAAIQFLNQRDRDKPFLAYVSYTSPHDPRMALPRFANLYPPHKIKLPANFLPEHPFDNGEMKVRDEMLAPFPRTPEAMREHIAAYYAMITEVDHHIGRVLDALEQSGQADNTYVIFSADNGLAVGQHGLLGKQNLYDHSVRVPLVIAGPGIPKGRRCDSLCYLMDVCPTILDLAGVPVPASVEAASLRPQLRNPRARLRDDVIFAYRHFQRAVRTDRWKLVLYNVQGNKTTQLFDLANDPHETRNLAGEPRHAARVRELTALLQQRLRDAGDLTDLAAAEWPAFTR